MIEDVRRALGRAAPLESPPEPPAIEEPITRLVHTDIGLPELFAKRAADQKMGVTFVYAEELIDQLVQFLRANSIRKIALPVSKLLSQLDVVPSLRAAGFDARTWDTITLDELYDDFDCAVTDVTYAVAECGALVIRTTPEHGRGLTLVPMYHVAILEPRNFLPDMVDLFERLGKEGAGYTVMITGPSKTADIEMNVVTGVHGPNVVHAFILQ